MFQPGDAGQGGAGAGAGALQGDPRLAPIPTVPERPTRS